MVDEIDRWLGRAIFQPLVIFLCKISGLNQYAVSRICWLLAALTLVINISFGTTTDWLFSCIAILFSAGEAVRAGLGFNKFSHPDRSTRIIVLAVALLGLVDLAFYFFRAGIVQLGAADAWPLLAMVAEYAKTIEARPSLTNSIPPTE